MTEAILKTMTQKTEKMRPIEIHPVQDKELLITWEDSHRSLYAYDYLRLHCPCAGCVDEWTGKRMLKPEDVAKNIRPLRTDTVGHYAIRFQWTDGHATGLFSFDYLRSLCPCTRCKGAAS